MSLRRHLFTLLLVSCVALVACVLGTLRLANVGASAREASAAEEGTRAMLALAHRIDGGLDPDSPALASVLEDLARMLEDGSVGLCDGEGVIGVRKTTFGPHRPPGLRGDLLPLDRQHISALCRRATVEAETVRRVAPFDVLSIAARRTRGGHGPVAFTLARSARFRPRPTTTNLVLLAVAGTAIALLLGLTAHGAWVLRTSTASLQTSLEALKLDLRAPVARPRASELANVADHLRTLATTLADAHARERALGLEMAEQKRLAGLGRVTAGLAHEVRNPLAGIKLRLDSMALRPLDARSSVDVEKCLREVARLDRLVQTLLLASRKRTPERAAFAAGSMIDERIALAAPLSAERAVEVAREGDATIVGDREELCRVVDNLVRNAIEASPPGARVIVRVHAASQQVQLDVLDEGPGIADDRLGELFEPFFTTKGSGTGLGLVLARASMEAQGGSLHYERRDDRTLFSLRIPNGDEGVTHG